MIATPYPELSRDVTDLAAELATWSAEVQRSMDEYWTHPQARCGHNGNCTKAYRRALAARR